MIEAMERSDPTSAKSDTVLLLALLFSGFAALGYELLWTRLLSLVLGSESLAVLGVLAGFFGGMVFGACYFNRLPGAGQGTWGRGTPQGQGM